MPGPTPHHGKPLSLLTRWFAAELAQHDFSDAPYRTDKAGHHRDDDREPTPEQLTPEQADAVRLNAFWVIAQVMINFEPGLDLYAFAEASGVPARWLRNRKGRPAGIISSGIRTDAATGVPLLPGHRPSAYRHDEPEAGPDPEPSTKL